MPGKERVAAPHVAPSSPVAGLERQQPQRRNVIDAVRGFFSSWTGRGAGRTTGYRDADPSTASSTTTATTTVAVPAAAETYKRDFYAVSHGGCVFICRSRNRCAPYGFFAGDTVEHTAGSFRGAKAIIAGERGGRLWCFCDGEKEALPLHGSTKAEIEAAHGLKRLGTGAPLPITDVPSHFTQEQLSFLQTAPDLILEVQGLEVHLCPNVLPSHDVLGWAGDFAPDAAHPAGSSEYSVSASVVLPREGASH